MKEGLTRRDFIKASVGLGIAGVAALSSERFLNAGETAQDPVLGVEMDKISLEERKAITRRLYDLTHAIPEEVRVGISSREDLQNWTREILPYFQYEGMIDEAVEPSSVIFAEFSKDGKDGQRFNHVLATANCMSQEVEINNRVANPVSSWYQRDDSIQTLAHELVHVQGVCWGDSQKVETTAQVLSFEVLSAMLLHGNKEVAYSIFSELAYMGLTSVKAEAIAGKTTWEDYLEFRNEVLPDPLDRAWQDKSDMYWTQDEEHKERWQEIITWYNKEPFDLIVQGLQQGFIDGNDLHLPNNWIFRMAESSYPPYDYSPSPTPEASPVPTPTPDVYDQKLNNLIYVVKHAEELVGAL